MALQMSPTISTLASALIDVQKQVSPVPKDKTNPFFKSSYVGLDTVMPIALQLLTAHGLGLIVAVFQQ